MALTPIFQPRLHNAGPQLCSALTDVSNSTLGRLSGDSQAPIQCDLAGFPERGQFRPYRRLTAIELCLTIPHAWTLVDSPRLYSAMRAP